MARLATVMPQVPKAQLLMQLDCKLGNANEGLVQAWHCQVQITAFTCMSQHQRVPHSPVSTSTMSLLASLIKLALMESYYGMLILAGTAWHRKYQPYQWTHIHRRCPTLKELSMGLPMRLLRHTFTAAMCYCLLYSPCR
jgi:hypothetical protein